MPKKPKITLYTTSSCVFCRAEKAFLDQHKIKYTEKMLDDDREAQLEMVKLSGQLGVPFTVIEKSKDEAVGILGFDQGKLTQELGISG